MKRLTFNRPHKLSLLHDQLLAAGIIPELVEDTEGDALILTVPDNVTEAAVQAVLDAHDPTQPSLAELADEERSAARSEIAQQYTQAVNRLSAIVDNGGTYTAAQVRDAVVDEARILRAVLRLLRQLAA